MTRTILNKTSFACCSLLIATSLANCAAEAVNKAEAAEPNLNIEAGADRTSGGTRILGAVEFGTSKNGSFYGGTRVRPIGVGYTLTGKRGSRVKLDLTSANGDAVLSLYGPLGTSWASARRVAYNDDISSRNTNSRLSVSLPADGTYLAVAQEYYAAEGTFTLALECTGGSCKLECNPGCPTGSQCVDTQIRCVRAPCPSRICMPLEAAPSEAEIVSCNTDSDCISVPTSCCGCSMGGRNRAINRRYESYATLDCSERQVCLAVYLCRAEAPACVANKCELVPQPAVCAEQDCGPRPEPSPRVCRDGRIIYASTQCQRTAAGACRWNISAPQCPEAGDVGALCGGRGLGTCKDGLFCKFERSANCGRSDAPGACAVQPTVCTREFAPVCGCSGTTHANACNAHAAGDSVDRAGSCITNDV